MRTNNHDEFDSWDCYKLFHLDNRTSVVSMVPSV